MALVVSRHEHDRQAGDGAAAHRRRRFAPGTGNRLLARIFKSRQVVDAGTADNAKHCLCHADPDATPKPSSANVPQVTVKVCGKTSPVGRSKAVSGHNPGGTERRSISRDV